MFAPTRIPRFARLSVTSKALTLLLCLGVCASTSAKCVYVNKNAPSATHDGIAWPTAFLTAQEGENAASSGDEVWVASSTPAAPAYVKNITLHDGIRLYGGFSGTETARSQRDWKSNVTVLDGNGSGSVVTVPSTATVTATFDGFTVRNGGDGILVSAGSATLTNNTILGNYYAGVYIYSGTVAVTNSTISANRYYGVLDDYGAVAASNNTITENGYGGVFISGTATLCNNIISGNLYSGVGVDTGGIISALSHNDVVGNGADYSGPTPYGEGNISQDPLFVQTGVDFHLHAGSPCVDAGDDGVVTRGETDEDGKPRIIGPNVDMGAYEYGPVTTQCAFTQQPWGAPAAMPLSTQPTVSVTGFLGDTPLHYNGSVIMSIKSGSGTVGAVLGGTTAISADNGIAAFTDLSIDKQGSGYVVTATGPGFASVDSARFDVKAHEVGQSTVWAWGGNNQGQLGDGTTTSRSVPVLIPGMTYVDSASTLGDHNVVLKTDGTVWAWGWNNAGQLGDGTTMDRSAPVQVSHLTNVRAVSAGSQHSLALRTDGTMWAWGSNGAGQLGDGTSTDRLAPVDASGLTDVKAVSAGGFFSLALKTDGTVWAWGANSEGELGDGTTTNRLGPIQVSGLSSVAAICAGCYHSLALKQDGSVWAWGWNAAGQLGDGTTTDRLVAVQVPGLANVVAVSANYDHSLVVTTDGTAWAWGSNGYGQLGDGTQTSHSVPFSIPGLPIVKAVSAGGLHSLAVMMDGTVWGWGSNANGQLGSGSQTNQTVPHQILGMANVASVIAGYRHSVAMVAPRLAFLAQPRVGAAGSPLSTQPVVEILAPDGTVESAFTGQVTLSIKPATGAAGARLGGRSTVTATNGVATFTDLSIDRSGLGYVLVAACGTLLPVESQPFNVYAPPAHLVFATQPDLAEAGKPFQQQPVALARDAINVLIADYNGPVTLGIKAGTGAPGAALIGASTVMAVNGVATFTDLGVDKKGTGYVLGTFVGTNRLGESAAFDVAPAAQRLVFTAPPAGATDDWPFTSQPIVSVVDADGDVATLNRSVVALAINPGTGSPGTVLNGTSTATALHGIAGFTGLNIEETGSGYVLTASSPGLASVDSSPFDVIEAPKLVLRQSAIDEIEVSVHPAGANIVGATVALSWQASDLKSASVSDVHPVAGWSVDLADTSVGVTATMSNPGTNSNGVVLTLHLSAQPGFAGHSATVSLTDSSDLTDDGYNTIPVLPRSVQFIPGAHLAFTRQPVLTTASQIIAGQPTVVMLDGTNSVVADFTDPVSIAIKPGTGATDAVLGGTTAVNAIAGIAGFNNLTIDRKGTGYVLVASSGAFSTESMPFDIAPKALKLAFTTQPGNARAGLPMAPQPVVAVQDEDGATAFAFTGPIALAIKPGTGFPGATLAGTSTLNAVAGVASFSDVRIDTAAPGYMLTASGQSLTGAESSSFDVSPFTFTTADVRNALRWAAGIAAIPDGYIGRFDVVPNGKVDLADAVRISRKAVGLEANP